MAGQRKGPAKPIRKTKAKANPKAKRKPPARKRGKPPHAPTDTTRAQVKAMAGFGIKQQDIAKVVGISKPTLEKYYRAELDTGMIVANSMVAESLYHMATTGKVPAAAMFWMKCRAGWKEVEPAGPPRAPEETARAIKDALVEIEKKIC